MAKIGKLVKMPKKKKIAPPVRNRFPIDYQKRDESIGYNQALAIVTGKPPYSFSILTL